MELKKIESKKAQEFSITTLVVLVLAVIVLVIVVLGFWKGWDYIFGKIGILPGNLEAVSQSCSASGKAGLVTSYCYEMKSVTLNGEAQYMNCNTLKDYAQIDALTSGDCDTNKVAAAVTSLCKTLPANSKVNNVVCPTLTCSPKTGSSCEAFDVDAVKCGRNADSCKLDPVTKKCITNALCGTLSATACSKNADVCELK